MRERAFVSEIAADTHLQRAVDRIESAHPTVLAPGHGAARAGETRGRRSLETSPPLHSRVG